MVTAQVLPRSDEAPVGELFDYGCRVLDTMRYLDGPCMYEITPVA
ncbi:hypothetical protein [Kitasatospora humi]|nr:hypothetical protein [Kitasatospora humi]